MITPIGIVKSSFQRGDKDYKNLFSDLIMHKEFIKGLDGIQEFSHIYVLYWMQGHLKGGS